MMPNERFEAFQYTAQGLGCQLDYTTAIQPGDLYLAVRNGPVQLLTCRRIAMDGSCIYPLEEGAYVFDTHECVRVVP